MVQTLTAINVLSLDIGVIFFRMHTKEKNPYIYIRLVHDQVRFGGKLCSA